MPVVEKHRQASLGGRGNGRYDWLRERRNSGEDPDQVDGIVGAADFRLSEDEIDGIDRFARANVWMRADEAA